MARLARTTPGSPFLTRVGLVEERVVDGQWPFTVPALMRGLPMSLTAPVTFLVGENGCGKSTLIEALAWRIGFSEHGGDPDNSFSELADGWALGRALALAWRQRIRDGFYLRAETFFQVAEAYEQEDSDFRRYGGRHLHRRSHGEAFLALFDHRLEDGIYLLDEPEAALSPSRQLSFLAILKRLADSRCAQFIIATHSPILITLPDAVVLACDDRGMRQVRARDTEHFRLTRDFLQAPERYFRHLFEDSEDDA